MRTHGGSPEGLTNVLHDTHRCGAELGYSPLMVTLV